jgi:hypothetical protein
VVAVSGSSGPGVTVRDTGAPATGVPSSVTVTDGVNSVPRQLVTAAGERTTDGGGSTTHRCSTAAEVNSAPPEAKVAVIVSVPSPASASRV